MKIILVNPLFPLAHSAARLAVRHDPPLGLGYIAAYLRRAGHGVDIYDLNNFGMTEEAFLRCAEAARPDLVGLSTFTSTFMSARRLASEVKRRVGCLTVMGGPHATALPRSTLGAVAGLDAVIKGEGELPMLALASQFDERGRVDFSSIPGAAFFDGDAYRENPAPAPIEALDELPYPARDLHGGKVYFRRRWLHLGQKSVNVISSRGCPGQCTFCANICLGRRFRAHSPAYFVGELERLRTEHGVTHFQIYDDCFTADTRRVAAICELLLAKKLDVRWGAFGRVNTLQDEGLLRLMKRAGCRHILLGIESGSQKILDLMKKGTTLAAAERCCALLRRCGIACSNSFILGGEGETMETAEATIAFACKLGSELVNIPVMVPFPGTPLFEKYYKDYDRPDTDWDGWEDNLGNRPYAPRQTALTAEELLALQGKAYRKYNMHPVRALRTLIFGSLV